MAIFGLGLMGGSLAMALKGHCLTLTGIDPDPAAVQSARQQAIVNRAAVQPGNLLADADLIILAAPVNTILIILASLPALCAHRTTVLDFGSTKRMICKSMRELPEQFDPIGGHPMCGKEISGLENADPEIFRGANFVLVPLERTTLEARRYAEELVKLIGSYPVWMDADSHDTQVASTSHLPFLVANALAYCTPLSAAPLAACGFASTTRLAVSPASMMLDVIETNQDSILISLHQYRQHLVELENLISTGDLPALQAILTAGAENRKLIELNAKGETL